MIIHIDVTAIVEVVSFGVFLWLLNLVLYQPMSALFRQRNAQVEAGLLAAEKSRQHAEETQREVQRRLDAARAEAQSIIAAAAKEAAAQRQALMAQARGQAETLTQQAQAEIQRERQAAVEALRREVVPLAVLVAGRVVGASLDDPANRAVAERAVADVGAVS